MKKITYVTKKLSKILGDLDFTGNSLNGKMCIPTVNQLNTREAFSPLRSVL